MAKVKIELNRDGVKQLMQSDEMMSICEEHANAILARCGDGYAMDSQVGKTRVNAMVFTETPRAMNDNLKNNTILKAVKG